MELTIALRAPAAVIANNDRNIQPGQSHRIKLAAVKAERAIARHQHHASSWPTRFRSQLALTGGCTQCQRGTNTHGAEWVVIEIAARCFNFGDTKHPVQNIRSVTNKDGIFRHDVHQVTAQAIGVDRSRGLAT